jgi:hypothetical protein
MKEYIIQNYGPILLGICIGLVIAMSFTLVENIITKIAILQNK